MGRAFLGGGPHNKEFGILWSVLGSGLFMETTGYSSYVFSLSLEGSGFRGFASWRRSLSGASCAGPRGVCTTNVDTDHGEKPA